MVEFCISLAAATQTPAAFWKAPAPRPPQLGDRDLVLGFGHQGPQKPTLDPNLDPLWCQGPYQNLVLVFWRLSTVEKTPVFAQPRTRPRNEQ